MAVTPISTHVEKEPAQFNNQVIRLKQPAKLTGSLTTVQLAEVAQDYTHQAPAVVPSGNVQQQAQTVLNQMGLSSSWNAVDYIFSHESGWTPTAVNELGCSGLGQSCNGGSGLKQECPDWQTNTSCQVRHFTSYANARYGSWAGAYAFWTSHHWW